MQKHENELFWTVIHQSVVANMLYSSTLQDNILGCIVVLRKSAISFLKMHICHNGILKYYKFK